MKAQIVKVFGSPELSFLPVLVDSLLLKFLGEEQFSSPRFQQELPIFRAMHHDLKVSSRYLVVLTAEISRPVPRMMEEMEALNLLPATYADLLYFVSNHRDMVNGPVMAFGTKVYQKEEVYKVPTADGGLGNGTDKLFYLAEVVEKKGFGGGWAYLAYPKPNAELLASSRK